MHNFLPTGLVHLSIDMLEQHGLYELLRASGIRLGSATQRMCAKNASAAEARILHENRGAALLTVERTAYDETGRPLEFASHLYRASRYAFTTSLSPPRHHRHPPRAPLRYECGAGGKVAPFRRARAEDPDAGSATGESSNVVDIGCQDDSTTDGRRSSDYNS